MILLAEIPPGAVVPEWKCYDVVVVTDLPDGEVLVLADPERLGEQ